MFLKRMLLPGCIQPPEQSRDLSKPMLHLGLIFPIGPHSWSACTVDAVTCSEMIKKSLSGWKPRIMRLVMLLPYPCSILFPGWRLCWMNWDGLSTVCLSDAALSRYIASICQRLEWKRGTDLWWPLESERHGRTIHRWDASPGTVGISATLPGNLRSSQSGACDLPDNWDAKPPTILTAIIGREWLAKGASAALRVPSVMLPFGKAWNLVLNPAHTQCSVLEVIEVVSISVDPRLK